MAKKRYHKYKPPTSVHPSLSTEASSSRTENVSQELSVRELIARSRTSSIQQSPEERAREVNAIASSRTVHPSLSSILAVPPPLQPKSRTGTRAVGDVSSGGMARPPPGPPAPSSWLTGSVHAPPELRGLEQKFLEWRANWIKDLSYRPRHISNPIVGFSLTNSLEHHVLKAMAKSWDFQVQHQQDYLAMMPQHLKMRLLGYIAVYGPSYGVGMGGLKALFATEDQVEGATGSESITSLDLSCSLARSMKLPELIKFMTAQPSQAPKDPLNDEIHSHLINYTSSSNASPPATTSPHSPSTIPDHWDADAMIQECHQLDVSLLVSPQLLMFPSLVHLSLAHPGPQIFWWHLLNLSQHIRTLTHLSLAYWPLPTLISSASHPTKFIPPPMQPTVYRALPPTHDWAEAKRIIRGLSRTLTSLRTLDLTGCGHWSADALHGAEWITSWRLLDRVILSQGWRPDTNLWSPSALERARAERHKRMRGAIYFMGRVSGEIEEEVALEDGIGKWMGERVKEWEEVEARVGDFREWVKEFRHAGGGKWIEVVGSEGERVL